MWVSCGTHSPHRRHIIIASPTTEQDRMPNNLNKFFLMIPMKDTHNAGVHEQEMHEPSLLMFQCCI